MNDSAATGGPETSPPLAGAGEALTAVTTSHADARDRTSLDMPSLSTLLAITSEWLRLARPHLLPLSVAPAVAVLTLFWAMGGRLLAVPAIFSIVALILVQSGAHMLDEYLEFDRANWSGASTSDLAYGEAGMILARSAVPPLTVLRVSIGLFVLGALSGIPLLATGGVGVALLGIAGVGTAFLYSSTSYALKQRPGGEIAVFLAFGPGIAVAVSLAQRLRPGGATLLVGCALGLLALALALVDAAHLRSMERDARKARRTLVTFIGIPGCRLLYAICLFGAFVLIALVAFPTGAPHGALAVLLALPAALIALTSMLLAQNAIARASIPRQTLRVYTVFALLLIAGLLASGIVARIAQIVLHSGA